MRRLLAQSWLGSGWGGVRGLGKTHFFMTFAAMAPSGSNFFQAQRSWQTQSLAWGIHPETAWVPCPVMQCGPLAGHGWGLLGSPLPLFLPQKEGSLGMDVLTQGFERLKKLGRHCISWNRVLLGSTACCPMSREACRALHGVPWLFQPLARTQAGLHRRSMVVGCPPSRGQRTQCLKPSGFSPGCL